MTAEYVTSEDHLPEDPTGEITLQVTDSETKAIFTTRARIARDRTKLSNPDPLTVVRGPHENRAEQWYIDVLDRNVDGDVDIDVDRLDQCIERSQEETNVVNARSEDLHALLTYLVETDEFGSMSEAVRTLLKRHLSEEYPDLVETYVDRKTARQRDLLAESLTDADS